MIEPVSLDEAKLQCRVTNSAEDDRFETILIPSARLWAEEFTGRNLTLERETVSLDSFPDGSPLLIELPSLPLRDKVAVTYTPVGDSSPMLTNVAFEDFTVETVDGVARLVSGSSPAWPEATAVTISYLTGEADSYPIPPMVKAAILLHLQAHYDQGSSMAALLNAAENLLRPLRLCLGMA